MKNPETPMMSRDFSFVCLVETVCTPSLQNNYHFTTNFLVTTAPFFSMILTR